MDASLTTYEQLKAAIEHRLPAAHLTILSGSAVGNEMLVIAGERRGSLTDVALDSSGLEQALELLAAEASETRTLLSSSGEASEVFIETFPPSPTLLIFGAVHVSQPLSRFAKALGYRVIVSDAREKLATSARFPDADAVIHAWPEEALQQIEVDRNTYIAVLTHDPKFDEPALTGSLATSARYIGAVGSRKTNEERRERLRQRGVSESDLSRVRGPIGLNIGAASPEEMAIAIMAEIVAVRHDRPGGPLTGAKGPIRGST